MPRGVYQRLPKSATPEERFWARVDRTGDGCWPWTGGTTGHGYGVCTFRGRRTLPHRVAYELAVGPIPAGLQIDHVRERGCTTRLCCRPDHLEAVTPRENLMRGDTLAAANAAKTHCPRGHAYTPENTYVRPSGDRRCRTCNRDAERARRRSLER